ncbi:hypothetical protein EJB05_53698, partial [Eragrostis curvula]
LAQALPADGDGRAPREGHEHAQHGELERVVAAKRRTGMEEAKEEESEEQQRVKGDGQQPYSIVFPDFPGGPGTFEAAAKFCYGVRVDFTAWNVAPLRCAAEYLEMVEEHAEDNLAARAEAFLEQTVLRHSGDATKALKSCEELLPLAEELGIEMEANVLSLCVKKEHVDAFLDELAKFTC